MYLEIFLWLSVFVTSSIINPYECFLFYKREREKKMGHICRHFFAFWKLYKILQKFAFDLDNKRYFVTYRIIYHCDYSTRLIIDSFLWTKFCAHLFISHYNSLDTTAWYFVMLLVTYFSLSYCQLLKEMIFCTSHKTSYVL